MLPVLWFIWIKVICSIVLEDFIFREQIVCGGSRPDAPFINRPIRTAASISV